MSSDNGHSWSAPPLQLPSPVFFSFEAFVDQGNVFVRYFPSATLDVVVSRDAGATWQLVKGPVDAGFSPGPSRTIHLAHGLGSPAQLFAYVGLGSSLLGAATAGAGGALPRLATDDLPIQGSTTTLRVTDVVGGSIGVIAVSFAAPQPAALGGTVVWPRVAPVLCSLPSGGVSGQPGIGAQQCPPPRPNSPPGGGLTAQRTVRERAVQAAVRTIQPMADTIGANSLIDGTSTLRPPCSPVCREPRGAGPDRRQSAICGLADRDPTTRRATVPARKGLGRRGLALAVESGNKAMAMNKPLRITLAAAALALSASAQSATMTFFGSASGSISFGEQLTATGLPQLGATFSVGVTYTIPPTTCLQVVTPYAVWLVLGFSNQSWLGLPLPLAMPQGFDLLVAPDSVVQAVVMSGTSCPPITTAPGQGPSFALTIPNDAGLLGLQFHQQILMSSAQGVTFGAPPIATNGGTATIGT